MRLMIKNKNNKSLKKKGVQKSFPNQNHNLPSLVDIKERTQQAKRVVKLKVQRVNHPKREAL